MGLCVLPRSLPRSIKTVLGFSCAPPVLLHNPIATRLQDKRREQSFFFLFGTALTSANPSETHDIHMSDCLSLCIPSPACLGSDRSQLSAVRRVLERETHSPFYQEGVSYALLKVTELGLVTAAEILLEFGADLSFEGTAAGKGGAVWGCSLLQKTRRVFAPRPRYLLHPAAHRGAPQPAGRGGAAGAPRGGHQPQRPGTDLPAWAQLTLAVGTAPPHVSPAVGGLLRRCLWPNKPVPAAVGGRRLV